MNEAIAEPADQLGRSDVSGSRLRSALLGILLLGLGGTLAELFLLEHYEELWQWLPMVMLGAGLIVSGVAAFRPRRLVLRALRLLMALFVVAGALGVYLHLKGNVEFELEMAPDMRGLELLWESLRGATPALAPASMAWLGLIGLAYTWRHPGLRQ